MGASGVSLVAAFVGGVASFSSPYVLPLVPAYLSIVGGLAVSRRAEGFRDVKTVPAPGSALRADTPTAVRVDEMGQPGRSAPLPWR